MNLQIVFCYKETHSQEGQFMDRPDIYVVIYSWSELSGGVISASSKCLVMSVWWQWGQCEQCIVLMSSEQVPSSSALTPV